MWLSKHWGCRWDTLGQRIEAVRAVLLDMPRSRLFRQSSPGACRGLGVAGERGISFASIANCFPFS